MAGYDPCLVVLSESNHWYAFISSSLFLFFLWFFFDVAFIIVASTSSFILFNSAGTIPNNINFLPGLEDLRIQENKLSGMIPETIADLSNLFRFEVQSNFLSGSVPEEIGSIPQLRDVKVQLNSFTGVIPASLCFLESMEILVADCLLPVDDGSVTSFLATTTECYCCTSCCDPITEECVTY